MIGSFLFFLMLLKSGKSHSWIHCSDYRGSVEYYDEKDCYGHPRPLPGGRLPATSGLFGLDIGFNQQPSVMKSGVQECHGPAQDQLDLKPSARYRPGQVVTLAWPSKNHVAATCTNQWIPDTRVELYVAPYAESGHPTSYTQILRASFTEEPHENGKMDFKGFQNCPKFCENMDKALCTGDFTVPDLSDGLYTFQWVWEFNAGTAPYVTCFEAWVGKDVSPVTAPTQSPTVKGATPSPIVNETPSPVATETSPPTATEGECIAKYNECGKFLGNECCGASKCFRQSQWYSQCLDTCPQGWDCYETPQTPTAHPTNASPTADPVEVPPTADPTEDAPVSECAANYDGTNGLLQKPTGQANVSAVLNDACSCAKFCTIFSEESKAFVYKKASRRCSCYAGFKKMKKRKKGKTSVGTVPLKISLSFSG